MAYDQHSAHTPGPRCAKRSAYWSGLQAERGETVRCGDDQPRGGTFDLITDLIPYSTPIRVLLLRDRCPKQIRVFLFTIFLYYCLLFSEYAL
jgi:hypothetical protein